mgnify:CR=1 FL=1
MAVLTWSGIAGVNRAFYDIARTMGASERFLILKVAIPGAMPHVFVGLFMGMGASFSVLVVAEMMGVKAGLGWYLQWAQGWAAYANMYAALLVMALMCSTLITLLFRARDHLLAWQKGLVPLSLAVGSTLLPLPPSSPHAPAHGRSPIINMPRAPARVVASAIARQPTTPDEHDDREATQG